MARKNEPDEELEDEEELDDEEAEAELENNEDDEEDDELENYDAQKTVGAISTVLDFLRPYYRPYRSSVVLLILGVLAEMSYNVAFPLSLKYLIDEALYEEDLEALVWILIILGSLGLFITVVSVGYDYLNAKVAALVMGDLRQRLFAHLQELSAAFYSRTKVGEILSRFSGDLGEVEEIAAYGIASSLLPVLELVTATALLFYLSWQLALVAMLIWPLTLIGPLFFSPRAVTASYQKKVLEADALSVAQENVSAQQVVKTFGLQGIALGWFRDRNQQLVTANRRVYFLTAMVERAVSTAVLLLHLLILGFGSLLTFKKIITIGTLVTFESVFWELSYNIGHATQFIPTLIHGAGSIRHIKELLDEPPRFSDAPNAYPLPRLDREIAFRDVTFSYTGDEPQLKQLNLLIPCGSQVAVVGPSGSGKSTILNLLLRLYDPTAGEVTIDGHDIRQVTRDSLRSQMAVVFQENILFNISLRENIRLGNPAATDAEVEAAARTAEIHKFIKSLPDGYDTIAGERGGRMSGGQRQRVAIARAIIRNPAILILDEATSALDHATEAAINATLNKLARGRTVVSVTHRLSSVVNANQIIVLDQGEMVESGTHAELLKRHGLYHQLWVKQSGHE